MAVKTGFLYDEDFRPIIKNGGFAVGPVLAQEASAILHSNKTEHKHDLLCGCDLTRKEKGPLSNIRKTINLQMERDGKRVTSLRKTNNEGGFDIDVEEL